MVKPEAKSEALKLEERVVKFKEIELGLKRDLAN
jgi:hypothetical protein